MHFKEDITNYLIENNRMFWLEGGQSSKKYLRNETTFKLRIKNTVILEHAELLYKNKNKELGDLDNTGLGINPV